MLAALQRVRLRALIVFRQLLCVFISLFYRWVPILSHAHLYPSEPVKEDLLQAARALLMRVSSSLFPSESQLSLFI